MSSSVAIMAASIAVMNANLAAQNAARSAALVNNMNARRMADRHLEDQRRARFRVVPLVDEETFLRAAQGPGQSLSYLVSGDIGVVRDHKSWDEYQKEKAAREIERAEQQKRRNRERLRNYFYAWCGFIILIFLALRGAK